jgi:virginiamycin B lyase
MVGVTGAAIPSLRSFVISASAGDLTLSPGGLVYFTEPSRDRIGQLDPLSGAIRTFKIPSPRSGLRGLTWSDDGWVTFAEARARKIGRLVPATGEVREFPTAEGLDPDVPVVIGRRIYFSAPAADAIGMLEAGSGEGAAFALPHPGSGPRALADGGDGGLYYCARNRLGRFDLRTDRFAEYSIPTPAAGPCAIAIAGATLYLTEASAGKLASFDLLSHAFKEWRSPGGPNSHPCAIVSDHASIWYEENSPARLVHFRPRDRSFSTLALPLDSSTNALASDSPGRLWLAPAGANTLMLVEAP